MDIVKLIFKIILGVLRVPCTIWYVVTGLPFKVLMVIGTVLNKIAVLVKGTSRYDFGQDDNMYKKTLGILSLEWASFTKFYHFHW